ncbi:HET-domain-containing protein [Zopfia rhizophila CBS 207.26]|uniref:HET-domain-containing protein n=1 Tax=Zopfia rhizophila CBS 207.26 TaxID=1314779 RepID=A0A6A6D911_9PEZI|nr:HET-domain-containing protein [Zopfia rhizophila CBS 207.26]
MGRQVDYNPLNKSINEIRVLQFSIIQSPIDLVACELKHVSLDAKRPRYGMCGDRRDDQDDRFVRLVDRRDQNLLESKSKTLKSNEREDSRSGFATCGPPQLTENLRYDWGDFEALSYTWGDPSLVSQIVVNGIVWDVPRNLASALRILRDLPETKVGMSYWVDALCIDQNNTEEKNSQVKKMKSIYSHARAVIAWLGEEEETDADAIDIINSLHRTFFVATERKQGLEFKAEQWAALARFLKRPYWERLWIIQELAVNHHSTLFVIGTMFLSREMVLSAMKYCKMDAETIEQLLRQPCDRPWSHNQAPFIWAKAFRVERLLTMTDEADGEQGLRHILQLAITAKASDSRDNVFGLLGLLHPDIALRIQPDYSLSKLLVYSKFAAAIASTTNSLDILLSWTPSPMPSDWTLSFQRKHIQYLQRCKAGRERSSDIPIFSTVNYRYIFFRGYFIDTIDAIAKFTTAQIPSNLYAEDRPPSRTTTTLDDQIYQPTGVPLPKALHKTLLLDHPSARNTPSILSIPWTISPSDKQWQPVLNHSLYPAFNAFRHLNSTFSIFGHPLKSFFPAIPASNPGSLQPNQKLLYHLQLTTISLAGRTIITTPKGYLGLVPDSVKRGDVLAVVVGCSFPVILRRVGRSFRVVGEGYVWGLMEGEGMKGRMRMLGVY